MADTKLMTYAELGEAIGRSEVAARSVAVRKRWRRIVGNDGKARVAVPIETLGKLQAKATDRPVTQPDAEPVAQPEGEPDARSDARALITMLEARVAELTSEAKEGRVAITRVAVLEALLERDRERHAVEVKRLEDILAAERGRVDELLKRRAAAVPVVPAQQRRGWWPWRRSA